MLAAFTRKLRTFWDGWLFAAIQLRSSPLRTWTSVVAASWGIAFLVLFSSFLKEFRRADLELASRTSLGERLVTFPTKVDAGLAESLDLLQIQGISFYPWITVSVRASGHAVCGVTRAFFDLDRLHLEEGRPMHLGDILGTTHCCWISLEHKSKLPLKGPRSTAIQVGGQLFRVAGVYRFEKKRHPLFMTPIDPWPPDTILLPMTTAAATFPKNTSHPNVFLRVSDPSSLMNALDEVSLMLEDLGLNVKESSDSQDQGIPAWMETQFATHRRVGWTCIWIIVFFSYTNAANLMLVQRRERIREIGIIKSLGASSWHLFFHFLRESLLVGALGGSLGALAGAAVAKLMGAVVQWNVTIDPSSLRLGLLVSLVASLIVGLVPAWLGSAMDPSEALRHE